MAVFVGIVSQAEDDRSGLQVCCSRNPGGISSFTFYPSLIPN